jgi:hypothetical protein
MGAPRHSSYGEEQLGSAETDAAARAKRDRNLATGCEGSFIQLRRCGCGRTCAIPRRIHRSDFRRVQLVPARIVAAVEQSPLARC